MKITTLNVNGLRSAERRGFSAWLRRAKPDILCLQEIRCDQHSLDPTLWAPRGYAVAWFPAVQKGYAGTAIWVRKGRAKGARFAQGCGLERADAEGRVTSVSLPELDVVSMYLPSGSSGPERQAWKDAFLAFATPWFAERLASGRPTVVCGDLNIAPAAIDLRNWRANQKQSGFLPHERAWFADLLATGWQDPLRALYPDRAVYSWWSNRGNARANDVGWRIDHTLVSPGVGVAAVDIDRGADLSDHAPVTLTLKESA